MSHNLEYRTSNLAQSPVNALADAWQGHASSVRLPPRRPPMTFGRLVAENNPFYLLSAACMLLGLMTLTNSLSFSPIPHHRLIVLIATLNLYETVLIALAVWLIAKRQIVRDGEILLAIEALFLADGAMLGSEMFTAHLGLGAVVNLMLMLLAAGKLWFVLNALRLPISTMLPPLLLLQALVVGLPGLCKWSAAAHGGNLPPMALYAAWWTTALLPALLGWLNNTINSFSGEPWQPQRQLQPSRRTVMTIAAMAAVSIVVHLFLAGWVYRMRFYVAELSPLLLGTAGALALTLKPGTNKVSAKSQRFAPVPWMIGLTSLAVLLSMSAPSKLTVCDAFAITPLRCALLGAAVVFAIAFVRTGRIPFAAVSLVSLFLAALGSTFDTIVRRLIWPWLQVEDAAAKVIPSSPAGWGAVSVIFAFVLLAVGAMVSVRKRPAVEPDLKEVFSVALRETDGSASSPRATSQVAR